MAELLHYIEIDPQYTQKALDFLISEFQGKENIEKLLGYLVTPEEEFHELIVVTAESFLIEVARDWVLDQIGEQYGVSRDGQFDDEYRARIKALAKLSVYKGTWEDTIKIFENLFGLDGLKVTTSNPGTINVESPHTSVHKIVDTTLFDKLIPAGMRIRVIALASLPIFRFGSRHHTFTGVGFNSVNNPDADAGHYSSLYFQSE